MSSSALTVISWHTFHCFTGRKTFNFIREVQGVNSRRRALAPGTGFNILYSTIYALLHIEHKLFHDAYMGMLSPVVLLCDAP